MNGWAHRQAELPQTLEELMQLHYQCRYEAECRALMQPGAPHSLQRELLLRVEALRHEAQEHGNVHWDDRFTRNCVFLRETLCAMPLYDEAQKARLALILDHLQACGEYARRWNEGRPAEAQPVVERSVYVGDSLYELLLDAVGQLQAQHPEPLPATPPNGTHK